MIWSTADELNATVGRVREQCEALASGNVPIKFVPTSGLAPGVELDTWLHKDDEIVAESVLSSAYKP